MDMITMPPPHIGRVALAVTDLDRSIRYYEDVIGLTLLARDGDTAHLGAGDVGFLWLTGQPGARPVQRATGLYHFAILVPSRRDLARTLHHLLAIDGALGGWADHLVSEALYLTDPDGHGIEIYRDRPRAEWPYLGQQLRMASDPLDARGILAELNGPPDSHVMAPGTFVGHVHLQVATIAATEQFYIGLLGLDRVLRFGPSATFLSYNGYHHHLGANTWTGENLPPAPADAARLLWYELVLPDAAAVSAIAERLDAANYLFEQDASGLWVVDPSGIRVLLTADR
ncbi:Catechol-2,3-dioxygenase [Candidatus Promineifilum breve]|uniref:Catechol-2,3-dioxygenase n=2 Tax=Candidatus Promineifilum breve TaxID=1806508 RepID=A0A160T6P6_9CHLR|nr:Catechol-2,3-dioxygenase [Candidatus Promineifilum breve]